MPGDRPSEDDLQRQLQEACAELERRVRAGGAGLAADLFAAYPALAANRDAALTLAYTEFVLRERLGQRPDTEVWCAGFPGLHDSLLQLLQVHRAVHTEMGTGADPTKTAPLSAGDSGALAEIGRRIGGYELLGVLGRGGMGVVYAARQAGLNRVVALKMIHGGAGAGPDAAARFRREAEVVAGLQHPNIVQVFEVGDQDGCPFLTMEYVAGGSLDQRLPGAPIPTRAAAALIEALARAADFAHQRGVVHRDLKPANVLLQPHPAAETLGTSPPTGVEAAEPAVDLARVTPKIVDFGLAKVLAGSAVPTLSGAVLGTPSYMAPEQARGDTKHVGPAADVYALGTILYECLTGRPPFRGETVPDTLRLVATQDPVPPTTLNPRTPRDLETVCLKCLEKDPARRYGTALALANDLGHFLRDEPVLARPPSVAYQVRKFAKRHKALLAGTAAVFAALVAGLIGTGIGLVRARAALDRAVNAEQKSRALLAESYAQAARVALQRGAWRPALTNLNSALAADHPDRTWLSLQKVRAWCAVHDVAEATRELESLQGRTDLGALEGAVLLWQADIVLIRAGDDRAVTLARRALACGLEPAEAEYARGLLAESSAEAVKHFRLALKADPFHQRATGMLALTLITLGQMGEAREHATFASKAFPEDPTFAILRAVTLAWENDFTAAKAALEPALSQLGPRQALAAQRLLGRVRDFRRLGEALSDNPIDPLPLMVLRLMPVLVSTVTEVQALRDQSEGAGPALLLPIPPVLLRVVPSNPSSILSAALRDEPGPVIAELDRAFQIHPDGFFAFTRGVLAASAGRFADAEQAFLAAADTTSLIPIQPGGLYGALFCQWELADRTPAAKSECLGRAVQTARRFMTRGRLKPAHAALVASVLIEAGEFDLARGVIGDWERDAPQDVLAWRKRMIVEFRAGAYGTTVAAADKILKQLPDDTSARDYRAAAVQRLADQVKSLPH